MPCHREIASASNSTAVDDPGEPAMDVTGKTTKRVVSALVLLRSATESPRFFANMTTTVASTGMAKTHALERDHNRARSIEIPIVAGTFQPPEFCLASSRRAEKR